TRRSGSPAGPRRRCSRWCPEPEPLPSSGRRMVMAKADAEPRGPEPRRPDAHIEQAIGRLYSFLAANRRTRFSWAVIQTFSRAGGALLSGRMAYYTLLSLLPLLTAAALLL